MIFKNQAGQGTPFKVFNQLTGQYIAGDAANITGSVSKDGGAAAAFVTTTPTDLGGGLYWQPLTQNETNAHVLGCYWASTTTGIVIEPQIIHTDSGTLLGNVPQSGDGFLRVGPNGSNLTAVPAGVWAALLAALTTDGSVGQAFAAFLASLGGDGRVITSSADPFYGLVIPGTVSDGAPDADNFTGAPGLSSRDGDYEGVWLCFTSGSLRGYKRIVDAYAGTERRFTFSKPFPVAPADGDAFELI